MARTILLAAALAVALATPAPAADPVAGPAPSDYTLDGAVGEWTATPPTLGLVGKAAGARGGRIWVAPHGDGIVVAGAVDGPAPKFAEDAAGMPGGDHVELWLALVDAPTLPPIGWGHQFGPIELTTADDCAREDTGFGDAPEAVAACRAWFQRQQTYRGTLARLFVRQWQVAPGVMLETFARPAFEAMSAQEQEAASPLRPDDAPRAAFGPPPAGQAGYAFEIQVPWAALPPAGAVELGRMRLMVDVFSPGSGGKYGPFSTTSADRRYARIDTIGPVALPAPRRYRVSECDAPLTAAEFYGEKRLPAYYIPTAKTTLDAIIVLENPVRGYQYQPENPSPEANRIGLFSRTLAPGVIACGPELAVRRGETTTPSPDVELRPDAWSRPVTDGWLVANGPYEGMLSRLGTGACGACPTVALDVLFVPREAGAPAIGFSEAYVVEDPDLQSPFRNARIRASDDLRTITVWEGEPDGERETVTWTETRHCWSDAKRTFEACGRRENTPPPAGVAMPQEG